MKIFTYNQYIKSIHTLRLNAVLQLAEEGTKYNLEKKKQKDPYGEIIKNILKDEKEMAKLINGFLESKAKIQSENLIKYTNNHINKKYIDQEFHLIYKLKHKETFFLIEHQSIIDYTMQYKILNACINIMQEWTKTRNIKKDGRYPIIVPIIIYTGNEKWKMPKKIKEKQIGDYIFENYKIDLAYNVIEINKISTKFLLQKRSLFGYSMIIAKSKDKNELKENLELIVKNIKNEMQLQKIKDIIIYLRKNS